MADMTVEDFISTYNPCAEGVTALQTGTTMSAPTSMADAYANTQDGEWLLYIIQKVDPANARTAKRVLGPRKVKLNKLPEGAEKTALRVKLANDLRTVIANPFL